ncbi:MAG: hypothetical protein SGARI_002676, partial [Bacillariaceae sp.]
MASMPMPDTEEAAAVLPDMVAVPHKDKVATLRQATAKGTVKPHRREVLHKRLMELQEEIPMEIMVPTVVVLPKIIPMR